MDSNVIDLDKDSNCLDEDNSGAPTAEPTLKILKDFHNMYEERLSLVQRKGKGDTLQLQNTLLRSWVDDLVAQNSLLVQTVEELEMEAVKRIHMIEHQISAEQRKHAEIESELQSEISILRRQLGRKDSDLRGLVEVLRRLRERDPGSLNTIHFFEVTESDVFGSDRRKVRDHGDKENNELLKDGNERYRNKERGERAFRRKKRETPKDRLDKMNELKILNDTLEKENTAKDREIRRLTESLLQHEAIITSLRSQVSQATRDVTTKDANVSVCLCCTEDARCDEMEPVRDYCAMLKDETDTFDTKMAQMEMKLKSSVEVQRHLRTRNVQISEDVDWLRSVCCSLDERCRAATLCSQFKEEIIREMRRQLKQAKAKIFNETGKFATSTPNPSPVGASGTELGAVCAHSGIGNNMNNSPQPVTSHPESVHTCQCRTAGPHIQQLYLNESINRTNAEPCGKDTCLSNTTKIDRNGLDEALIVKGLAFARTQVKYLQTTLSAIKQTIEELGRNQSVREESFQLSCTDSAPKGSCSTDQIHYYQNKLLSTMQILSNKDEMLAIQEESLKMAEVRMSTLAVRNAQLQAELDKKIYEIKMLRQELEMKGRTPPPPDRNGSKTISKLQNNLSVIEKLYRDCFYESARQEEMIEMLRTSFLEVRLKNSEKSEEIDRLRGVVVSQKWNLERCQDIAQELDSLKGEIASALNNANNDSGVWERSEDSSQGDISRDLQDITQQLLQLKRVLSTDCTCGLRAENGTLKKANDMLNSQIADLNERLDTLEIAVTNRDNTIEHYKSQIKEHETEIQQLAANLRESERCREELLKDKEDLLKEKEEQLSEVTLLRTALRGVESSATATRQRTHETAQEMANARTSIEGLKDRLKNSKFQVKCRRSDAGRLQAICQAHESTIEKQREELSKAQLYLKENAKMRSEISYLSNQVKLWQAQLSESSQKVKELEEQLAVAQAAYDELQCSYRSKRESAVWLEHELAEASSRGAELCAESRHMVCGVRQWMQRMRQQHQEQQRKIQELQRKLRMVKMKLAASGTSQVGFVDCCYDPYARTSKGCLQSKRRSTEKSRCSMERSLPEAGSCSQGSTDIQTSPTPPSSLHFSKQMRCSDCIQNQSQPPGQCEEGTTSPSDDLTAAMDNAGADFRWHNQQWIERMKIFKSGSDQH